MIHLKTCEALINSTTEATEEIKEIEKFIN